MFHDSKTYFDLKEFAKPGNYKILQGSNLVSVISVNVDAKTLEADRVDIEKIVSKTENVELIQENEDVAEKVKEARFGEEIWKYIIGLALLVLLLEGFVVKKIEGKI